MMSTFTDLQFWTVVNLQTWGELAIRTLAKIVGEPEFALRFVTIANFFVILNMDSSQKTLLR